MRSAKTIGGFGLAIIISLFFIELFARYAYIENRSLNDYYEDIGRGRRRNFNYVHFNEGFGIGRFNDQRFIGGDLADNSPSGSIRIALLGDSYVESFQVFERDYFGSKASSILNFNYPEERIDVMNFGRSGFGLKNVYVYHKSFVEGFDPDYVLYFISGDDIRSSSNDPLLPKVYSVDNELRIDHHIDPLKIEDYEKTKWLIQNIVLVNMINNCFKKAREVPLGSILLDKFYTSWSSPVESKPETEKDISKDESIDGTVQLILDSLDKEKVIFVNRSKEPLPKSFQRLIFDKGFKFIDLSSTINEIAQDGQDPFYWNVTKKRGHWNHATHSRIGERLASEVSVIIEQNKLLKK